MSDLGENEMAKLHGRYLGGGRASLDNEVMPIINFINVRILSPGTVSVRVSREAWGSRGASLRSLNPFSQLFSVMLGLFKSNE